MSSSKNANLPVKEQCDAPGRQAYNIWGNTFLIDDVYVPIKAIGKGAYGTVCSAKNTVTGEKVAIKKIQNAFENLTDARRTLREIKLLRHLKHENVIGVRDLLYPSNPQDFKDVYIVYELMDTDLHQIIRSPQPLTDDHFQFFVYQILKGLKYVHTANVLHRDLKPSNLLVNASCDLRICDFGLARTSSERNFMTEYVVTRWYRAPELLLSCYQYTAAIDIWSVGCILAELLYRKPLFPGKDYIHQLKLIIKTLGSPSDEDLEFISIAKGRAFIKALPRMQRCSFRAMFPDASALAIDLMERMLQFNPAKRITVEDALQHPYLQQLHDPASELSAPGTFDFDLEEQELDESTVRTRVLEEMQYYNSARAAQKGAVREAMSQASSQTAEMLHA